MFTKYYFIFLGAWLIFGYLGLRIYRNTNPEFYDKFGISDLIVINILYPAMGLFAFFLSLVYRALYVKPKESTKPDQN